MMTPYNSCFTIMRRNYQNNWYNNGCGLIYKANKNENKWFTTSPSNHLKATEYNLGTLNIIENV